MVGKSAENGAGRGNENEHGRGLWTRTWGAQSFALPQRPRSHDECFCAGNAARSWPRECVSQPSVARGRGVRQCNE
ncbi:hypothetical protein CH063_06300 [Colletotrichum higginsianum]|uniref:Uncharacterized protein n=1 Tax=Colletotrichum higginsianum (strain IMI 349063) TaxID=759273 RepID=H1V222_COLHI|nr:hypothetical protein CH063_06300 [Colletotrichum higginsianum]